MENWRVELTLNFPGHQGLLEYFQFEPVSPTNNPVCFSLPYHHIDDYQWQTPSPWDTQQAYADAN